MTTIVALVLSLLFYGLEPMVKVNEEVYNKKATLSALKSKLDKDLDQMSNEEILDVFQNQITQRVINSKGEVMDATAVEALGYGGSTAEVLDMSKERKKPVADRAWPLYEYASNDGKKYYIMELRGNGLWDEIWGYISLESDLKTIAGVAFDHKAETPGLGAEIKDSKAFIKSFIGKKIFNDETKSYEGIIVRKGGAKNDKYEVDGITGATITLDGVTDMFQVGVDGYAPYFKKINK